MSTVMIVSESTITRIVLRNQLVECGIKVVCEVSSRLEAVISYRLHKPTIVVVDVRMQNGQAMGTIRDIVELNPNAVVISVATTDADTWALHSLSAGADGVFAIPGTADALGQEIERVMVNKKNPETYRFRRWNLKTISSFLRNFTTKLTIGRESPVRNLVTYTRRDQQSLARR